MRRFITVQLAWRIRGFFRLTTVAVAVCAASAAYAFAQLPSNAKLAKDGVQTFAKCARNGPATTTLRLTPSTRVVGEVVTATTAAPFFDAADIGGVIGLRVKPGLAKVIAVANSTNATIEITQGFGPSGPYGTGVWGRWPFCYLSFQRGEVYGYNAGGGHQKDINTPNLVLDQGQQYSVDRCSLAHDSFYWGPRTGDTHPQTTETACSNNHWVKFCFTKIVAKTLDEELILRSAYAVLPGVVVGPVYDVATGFLPAWQLTGAACSLRRPWVELPTNSDAAAAACYARDARLIVGLVRILPRGFDVSPLTVVPQLPMHGAKVVVGRWTRECNQKWVMVPGTGDPARYGYYIKGLAGKCLGTPSGRDPVAGDPVQMQDCNRRFTQKWHYEHGQIRSQPARKGVTRLCLAVKDPANPSDVIVAKCASIKPGNNPRQQWRFAEPLVNAETLLR